jgi:hypothetical protein
MIQNDGENSPRPSRGAIQMMLIGRHLVVVLVIGFAVMCGLIGLDFGYHWDEAQTLRSVVTTVETGVLLPSLYLYPGVNYLVPLGVLLPTAVRSVVTSAPPEIRSDVPVVLPDYLAGKPASGTKLDDLQRGLKLYAWSKPFLLRVRAVYLILSLLVGVWIYVLVLHWRKRWAEALLAASLVAFSWELGYHARWVAPDALMTSFVLLSLMLVFLSRGRPGRRRWLAFAAVSAGAACGTKYQGALALLPVLIEAMHGSRECAGARAPWKEWARLVSVFGVAYLITTPGTLLDPLRFWHDLWFQWNAYATGWEDHTLTRGAEHLAKLVSYLGFAAFSHFRVVAATVFLLAVVGAITVIRKNRWDAVILVGIPAFYVLYMAMQRVMFVRNYLVIVPFLAVLAARGTTHIGDRLARWRLMRLGVAVVLGAALCANAGWLWSAAQTIRVREFARYRYPIELLHYLQENRQTRFALSPKVRDAVRGLARDLPPNASFPLDSAGYAALYAAEITDPSKWDATHFDYSKRWFGTYEVNFNYYPSWKGEDRIVILRRRDAARLGLFESGRARIASAYR